MAPVSQWPPFCMVIGIFSIGKISETPKPKYTVIGMPPTPGRQRCGSWRGPPIEYM